MNYDLTVIIPIYNNEKKMDKCVKSILKNRCNIKIVVINDGSTDNTRNKLCALDKYIKVINLKDNKGTSYARNVGLKYVTTPYFTFVDSDDYIEPHMYDYLLEQAIKYDLDIVGCNYYEKLNNKVKSKYKYDDQLLSGDDIIKEALNDQLALVIWDKIYKTNTFKSIYFNEKLRVNEDYLYTISCMLKSKNALFINKYLYNYCKNNDSLTNNYTCEQIKRNDYIKYIDNKTLNKLKQYDEYDYYICNDILKQIHLYSKCIDKKNRYKYLRENINNEKLKQLLKYNINKLTKIEIVIYLVSIKLHLLLFPVYIHIRNKMRR